MNETRNTMLKRNVKVLAAIGALVAVTAVAAVAEESDSTATTVAPGEDVAQVSAIEPKAKAAAAVLARSRATGDALPTDVVGQMNEHPRFGMNPGLSRRAIGSLSNSLYLVPANGFVCVVLTMAQGASLSCPQTSDLAVGQSPPTTVGLAGGAIGVYGIVPDGVDAVTVNTDRSGSAVKVTNNAFFTVVPAGTALETVGYSGPSGTVEYPIYDPTAR
jgi:hypothetical protein